MSANFRTLPAVKLGFLDDNLILFVSRTPDAVADDAVGLRELADNPVLAPHPSARLYGRAQPNRLADFEFAHRYAPLKSSQPVYLVRSTSVTGNPLRPPTLPLRARSCPYTVNGQTRPAILIRRERASPSPTRASLAERVGGQRPVLPKPLGLQWEPTSRPTVIT